MIIYLRRLLLEIFILLPELPNLNPPKLPPNVKVLFIGGVFVVVVENCVTGSSGGNNNDGADTDGVDEPNWN